MSSPSIVWLRDDLRLADNPALRAAIDRDEPIVVLYVLDEESPGIRPFGGAARWWLHHSLASLSGRLHDLGATLTLRRGPAERVVREAVADTGASAVFWNRRYGASREIDAGTVWINQHGAINPHVPFGGLKASGYGQEFGVAGLKAVAAPKVIQR